MGVEGNNVVCDGCGADVGNGGVTQCTIVSRMNPDESGLIENLYLCRDRQEPSPTKNNPERTTKVAGCDSKALTPARLAYYTDQQNKAAKAK